jgi:phosphate ABC transporter phosphate-binding protein
MGKVFLCEHMILQRLVAAKLLRISEDEMGSSATSTLERFYREARAVATLDHPNIVRVFDVDRAGNVPFMVMEYVDGTNFHDLVARCGKLSFERAAQYIRQAAMGLEHAHQAGLIHRDIKPSNFIIDRHGVVKLLDLGLARFASDTAKNKGITTRFDGNVVMGTVDYMAPEQAVDSSGIDIRSDIYSLGCTMYFLLTGRPPFASGSIPQKMYAHQSQAPEPISLLCPKLPGELSDLIDRMLEKAPSDRFQTPREIVDALNGYAAAPTPPAEGEMPLIPASDFRLGLSQVAPPSPSAVTPNPESHIDTMKLPRDKIWNSPAKGTPRRNLDSADLSFQLSSPEGPGRKRALQWMGIGCLIAALGAVAIWQFTKEPPNQLDRPLRPGLPGPVAKGDPPPKPVEHKETPPVPFAGAILSGGGSTLAERMMQLWGGVYEKQKNVRINYQGVGSGKGSQGVIDRVYIFGCSDAPASDEQLAKAAKSGGMLIHIPLLMGAVVPCYNLPGVDQQLRFTGPILADIYLGKITHWNNQALKIANPGVQLPDMPIMVVARADRSGTSFIWTDFLSKSSGEWKSKFGAASTSVNWPVGARENGSDGIATRVSRDVGSIGYVELSWALENNLRVGQVKNRAGTFIEPKLESVTAAAAGSLEQIPEDLRYSLTDAPGKDSYPVAGTTWAIIYADQSNNPKAAELIEFLIWVTHDGQTYLKELKFAQLPPELVKLIDDKLATVKKPGK